MADRPTPLGERPVLAGLLALLGVAVVVGLLGGAVVLSGTKILGIGGGDGSDGSAASSEETLFIPEPEETEEPSGPRITLDVDPTPTAGPDSEDGGEDEESEEREEEEQKAKQQIELSAGLSSVSAMQRIDLSGTHPSGEGGILQVQRFENGNWADFPVTVSVRNGTFSTYVMTGRQGETRFRVVDTDSGKKSKPVTVTVN